MRALFASSDGAGFVVATSGVTADSALGAVDALSAGISPRKITHASSRRPSMTSASLSNSPIRRSALPSVARARFASAIAASAASANPRRNAHAAASSSSSPGSVGSGIATPRRSIAPSPMKSAKSASASASRPACAAIRPRNAIPTALRGSRAEIASRTVRTSPDPPRESSATSRISSGSTRSGASCSASSVASSAACTLFLPIASAATESNRVTSRGNGSTSCFGGSVARRLVIGV